MFPDTIAVAILLTGLNEPLKMGPANRISPLKTNPIMSPAILDFFLDATPKMVSIK